MKVVIYLHCLTYGGTERMSSHLANQLSSDGHDVTVLSNSDPGYISYPIRDEVKKVVMHTGGASGNPIVALWNNISRLRVFRRNIVRIQPDFLISMAPTVNVISAIGCLGTNIVRVGGEQSYPAAEDLGFVWRVLRVFTYRLLDTVVAQTETTRQWLLENTSARNVVVVPGAVVLPLDKFEPVVSPDFDEQSKVLLTVGRLSPEKQFDHLITAFAATRAQCPDWNLVIVGDGEARNSLETLIDELELGDAVLLPGFVGNVGDWYSSADLFALTSAYEGFPNALIEALAHGIPVVSYDCETGPSELIVDNVNGFLIEADSIGELREGLLRFMLDESKRGAAGESAKRIIETLGIEVVCDQWVALFQCAQETRR